VGCLCVDPRQQVLEVYNATLQEWEFWLERTRKKRKGKRGWGKRTKKKEGRLGFWLRTQRKKR
jgi:hypothetical protein